MSCEDLYMTPAERVDHARRALERAERRYDDGHGPWGEVLRTRREYADAVTAFGPWPTSVEG